MDSLAWLASTAAHARAGAHTGTERVCVYIFVHIHGVIRAIRRHIHHSVRVSIAAVSTIAIITIVVVAIVVVVLPVGLQVLHVHVLFVIGHHACVVVVEYVVLLEQHVRAHFSSVLNDTRRRNRERTTIRIKELLNMKQV